MAVQAVNDWNLLPSHVVLSSSTDQFKARLDDHWKDFFYTIPD